MSPWLTQLTVSAAEGRLRLCPVVIFTNFLMVVNQEVTLEMRGWKREEKSRAIKEKDQRQHWVLLVSQPEPHSVWVLIGCKLALNL